jgi:hypothetical protein
MLKQSGHPLAVAGKYLPQQYLIGPALLPLYRFFLKVFVLWILVPVMTLIVAPAAVLGGENPIAALVATLCQLFYAAVFSVGVVTIVFALVEQNGLGAKTFEHWDPRKLPALRLPGVSRVRSIRPARKQSVYGAIFALTCSVVFTVWWLGVLRGDTIYAGEGVRIALSPVWLRLYWPILAISLVGIAVDFARIYMRDWAWLTAVRIATACASLGVAVLLFVGSPWVDITAPGMSAATHAAVAGWANLVVEFSIFTTAAIVLAGAVVEVRALLSARP